MALAEVQPCQVNLHEFGSTSCRAALPAASEAPQASKPGSASAARAPPDAARCRAESEADRRHMAMRLRMQQHDAAEGTLAPAGAATNARRDTHSAGAQACLELTSYKVS